MTPHTIRHALETEAVQIKTLIHLVGINPTGLDWSRFIVALDGRGEIIGCGEIKPHGKEIRELASIAVHPNHRGKGVARAIIQRLLDESPRPLYLMCVSHNGGLYEKFGFHILEDNQLPRYFNRIKKLFNFVDVFQKTGEELLVMKLE